MLVLASVTTGACKTIVQPQCLSPVSGRLQFYCRTHTHTPWHQTSEVTWPPACDITVPLTSPVSGMVNYLPITHTQRALWPPNNRTARGHLRFALCSNKEVPGTWSWRTRGHKKTVTHFLIGLCMQTKSFSGFLVESENKNPFKSGPSFVKRAKINKPHGLVGVHLQKDVKQQAWASHSFSLPHLFCVEAGTPSRRHQTPPRPYLRRKGECVSTSAFGGCGWRGARSGCGICVCSGGRGWTRWASLKPETGLQVSPYERTSTSCPLSSWFEEKSNTRWRKIKMSWSQVLIG